MCFHQKHGIVDPIMSKKKIWILGNWKMNHLIEEAKAFFDAVGTPPEHVVAGVAPSTFVLGAFAKESLSIMRGAQNVYYAPSGAYTGETSLPMLKDCSVDFVIIGHSERRQHFGEGDVLIGKKVKATLESGLTAVLCVGETLGERELGEAKAVVSRQLDAALEGISSFQNLVIAYEPIWAIGTGKTATAADAEEVHAHIANHLKGAKIPLLYGGSVKPGNIAELVSQEHIDGALVGGASLTPESFNGLLEAVS